MPETIVSSRTVVIQGDTYVQQFTSTSNAAIPFSQSIAAAKVGQLTTRTDANTGVLTMAGGHGITTGQRLDVYWVVAPAGSRRGMTTVVSGNAVTIDLGSGDDLPTNLSAVTAMVPTSQALVVTGSNAVALAVSNPSTLTAATFVFALTDNSEVKAYVQAAATTYPSSTVWATEDGTTNPLAASAVTQVFLSHGNSAGAVVLSGVVSYN